MVDSLGQNGRYFKALVHCIRMWASLGFNAFLLLAGSNQKL